MYNYLGSKTEKIVPAVQASEYVRNSNYDESYYTYLPGTKITLTEPGIYSVSFAYKGAMDFCHVYIEVVEGDKEKADKAATAKAVPTDSKVMVNGQAVSFEAYNIGGSNYFKLRDLAKVVNGTEKQFEVTWDGSKNAINLVSNQPYTETGEELQKGDGQPKNAVLNTSKIYKDGIEVKLTAYTIKGNNYFKLRDIAAAFNIGVSWDGTANTVGIDTSSDYIVQ